MSGPGDETRLNEWWVPGFGPRRFRLLVGLSFYPYALMNASYVLIGSLVAPIVHLDRMWALAAVYLLAVGVSAHSFDALGINRPWGAFLSRRQLWVLGTGALVASLALGAYLALLFAPLLLPLGLVELFFLLAYNLELFGGRFHTDTWFAFSWGFLPVLAGYLVQTGTLNLGSLLGGFFGFFTASVEIGASRPYKSLRRDPGGRSSELARRLETILKGVVASVVAVAALLLVLDVVG